MVGHDRTTEFLTVTESLKKSASKTSSNQSTAANDTVESKKSLKGNTTQQSRFAQQASLIGKEIHATSIKLSRLADSIRCSSGLFNDSSDEINRLTFSVKGDINRLNARLESLQGVLEENSKNKTRAKHNRSVMGQLQKSLMQTTKGFGSVLQQRSKTMKERSTRRGRFGQTQRMNPLGKPGNFGRNSFNIGGNGIGAGAGSTGESSSSSTLSLNNNNNNNNRLTRINSPGAAKKHFGGFKTDHFPQNHRNSIGHENKETSSLLGNSSRNSVDLEGGGQSFGLTQRRLLVNGESYLTQRADAMVNVEKHISDLGRVFNKLSSMIAESRETIDRIDDNVDETYMNVQHGHNELMKYFESISSNRMLIGKIFFILLSFIIFFITFMV